MMDDRTQAEVFRLLLLMGIVAKADVIAWADSAIAASDVPPDWLIDVSLAVGDTDDELNDKLDAGPRELDSVAAACAAVARLANEYRDGRFNAVQSAGMLLRFAAGASLTHDDWREAMLPQWIAEEVEFEHMTLENVAECLERAFAHFEQMASAHSRANRPAASAEHGRRLDDDD